MAKSITLYLCMILLCSHEELIKVFKMLYICMHTCCQLSCPLVVATSITFCCRLPDVNKVLVQITDTMKLTSVLPRPEIA